MGRVFTVDSSRRTVVGVLRRRRRSGGGAAGDRVARARENVGPCRA